MTAAKRCATRLRAYASFFRIRFIAGLQYRIAALAGVSTQFAWGFMEILVFRAFAETDASALPMSMTQLSSYVWMQQAFLALFMVFFYDKDILDIISSGNIAYELARPADLYLMWFTKNLASRLSRAVLRCIPIFVVAAFLPAPYGMSLPASAAAALAFVPTMVMSSLTVVAFTMLVYIASFGMISTIGIRIFASSLAEFLSGAIIPIPFFPPLMRRITELTPFASMQNLPLRVYNGDISGGELLSAVALQAVWLFALVLGGRLWMRRSLRGVCVQGG